LKEVKVYFVIRMYNGQREGNMVMAGTSLDDEHLIMAAGFDPYDVFAEFKIEEGDILDFDKITRYGANLSEIIIDLSQAEEIYQTRFSSDMQDKIKKAE
jgi:hypothetical protein